jgi:dTDP-4-dehydrorhamnose reductase
MAARVLVFGSTGQVARELRRAPFPKGVEIVALDRAAADLAMPDSLAAVVGRHKPDAVIIAAAYTAVDKAESEEALAHIVNGEAPGAIAAAAADRGVPVVHFSTDYVFNGEKDGFYDEGDPTCPINAYGRSKLSGEEKVRAANPRHLILRTSWVYSAHGANFLRTMLRLSSREEVKVVSDQAGCPTAAGDLASALVRLLPAILAKEAPWGIYHLAGGGSTSWYGFAEAIFAEAASHGVARPRNVAIATSDYPTPARRPQNSRLSSARFERTFGFALPDHRSALPTVVAEAIES